MNKIQYKNYQIQDGTAGSIVRKTTQFQKTGLEKYIYASNQKPKSKFEEMKKYGIKPFDYLYTKKVEVKPTNSNSNNQKRNYLDYLAYSKYRPRERSNIPPSYPYSGQSVKGVDRKKLQQLNKISTEIYLKELTKNTQKLIPNVI